MNQSIFHKMRFFQKAASLTLLFFIGMMIFVTYMAYARKSGSTGIDMTKAQKLREEARTAFNPAEEF